MSTQALSGARGEQFAPRQQTAMADGDQDFSYPVPHVYDGIQFSIAFPAHILDRLKNELVLDPRDVVLAGYPKVGSTWMQEIIYLVTNGADIEERLSRSLDDLFPFLELGAPGGPVWLDTFQSNEAPRLALTHTNARILEREVEKGEKGGKFIVGLRNPKDCLVSFYHFHRMTRSLSYRKSWSDFYQMFKEGKLLFGSPVDYALSWDKHRDSPNVLFLHFEDLKKDVRAAIHKVAKFLNKPMTEEMADRIAEFTSFDAMKSRGQPHMTWEPDLDESISPFLRKGTVGDYVNYFTEEENAHMDELCEKMLKDSGITFQYKI